MTKSIVKRFKGGESTALTKSEEKTVLARLFSLRKELVKAKTFPEVKRIRDMAKHVAAACITAKHSFDVCQDAAELKIEAERQAGEMLAKMDKAKGGKGMQKPYRSQHAIGIESLSDIGVSLSQSSRWQQTAKVPQSQVEAAYKAAREDRKQVSSTNELVTKAKREATEEKRQAKRDKNQAKVEATETLADLDGLFSTIVIDPPWDWGDEGDKDQLGRATPTYDTMSIDDITALPVGDKADTNAHLYLWITNRSLPKGFALLKSWGFRYVTCLTWCKPSFGMGNYFRGSTEHVLFGVKGSLPLNRKDVGTWFKAKRKKGHSSKPDEFYSLVESCSPGPYLDVFSRTKRDGWFSWGADVD